MSLILGPIESLTYADARKLIKLALERGWAKMHALPSGDPLREENNTYKSHWRKVQRGTAAECAQHEPNKNGYCLHCGRKVKSIHADQPEAA